MQKQTFGKPKNIPVHIEVTDGTKADVSYYWNKLQSNASINNNVNTIKEIVVHCTDGSISLKVPIKLG